MNWTHLSPNAHILWNALAAVEKTNITPENPKAMFENAINATLRMTNTQVSVWYVFWISKYDKNTMFEISGWPTSWQYAGQDRLVSSSFEASLRSQYWSPPNESQETRGETIYLGALPLIIRSMRWLKPLPKIGKIGKVNPTFQQLDAKSDQKSQNYGASLSVSNNTIHRNPSTTTQDSRAKRDALLSYQRVQGLIASTRDILKDQFTD